MGAFFWATPYSRLGEALSKEEWQVSHHLWLASACGITIVPKLTPEMREAIKQNRNRVATNYHHRPIDWEAMRRVKRPLKTDEEREREFDERREEYIREERALTAYWVECSRERDKADKRACIFIFISLTIVILGFHLWVFLDSNSQ